MIRSKQSIARHQNSFFQFRLPFAMPPSPAPSSELALEEQKETAVAPKISAAAESDQAEPIAVDDDEEQEEAGGDTEVDDDEDNEAAGAATAAPAGDGNDEPSTAALDFDLPRSILRRIVKARLSEVAAQELGEGKEFGVSKEALEALGEGAKVKKSFEEKSDELLFSPSENVFPSTHSCTAFSEFQ